MDVLKALNELESLHNYGSEAFNSIQEVRSAIAELIGAAQYAFELADSVEGMSRNNIDNIGWEVAQRLGPAIANVRGQ